MTDWNIVNTCTKSFVDENVNAAWVKCDSPTVPMPERYDHGLWQSGANGEARGRIADAIRNAREMVCLSSFIIGDDIIVDALVTASERGIPCYVLTMSEQHLDKDLRNEDEYSQQMVEKHKQMLNSLAGRANIRTAPHLHSKFVLVDPKSLTNANGFISTANLNQKALTKNCELMLSVNAARTRQLFEQFKIGFWEEAEHEALEEGDLRPVGLSGRRHYDMKVTDLPMTTRKIKSLKARLLEMVSSATDELWLSSFGLDLNNEIIGTLIEKARSGVKVHVFLPMRPKNMAAAIQLCRNGAVVHSSSSLVHAKAVVSSSGDEIHGMIFTANIEDQGLENGFESGIVLIPSEASQLRSVLSQWSENFDYRLIVDTKLGQINGAIRLWSGEVFEDAKVVKTASLPAKNVVAESIDSMKDAKPTTFPRPGDKNPVLMPHTITYTWTVLPPKLPKGARESSKKGKYPIFEQKGAKYLLIDGPQDIESATLEANKLGAKIVAK